RMPQQNRQNLDPERIHVHNTFMHLFLQRLMQFDEHGELNGEHGEPAKNENGNRNVNPFRSHRKSQRAMRIRRGFTDMWKIMRYENRKSPVAPQNRVLYRGEGQ